MDTNAATSLDRLQDIVLPPPIPWWPPGPGWYGVILLGWLLAGFAAFRAWRSWRTNAYRREALRDLASVRDVRTIATLLRRTALARHPRSEVAALTGTAWFEWLVSHSPQPPPAAIHRLLIAGAYDRIPITESERAALHEWAAHWIARHRAPSTTRPG